MLEFSSSYFFRVFCQRTPGLHLNFMTSPESTDSKKKKKKNKKNTGEEEEENAIKHGS
jgi:hypothetical protein